jgi:hypothetical protein
MMTVVVVVLASLRQRSGLGSRGNRTRAYTVSGTTVDVMNLEQSARRDSIGVRPGRVPVT